MSYTATAAGLRDAASAVRNTRTQTSRVSVNQAQISQTPAPTIVSSILEGGILLFTLSGISLVLCTIVAGAILT